MQFIKNKYLKIFLGVIASLILIVALAVGSLQLSYFQTKLVNRFAQYIYEKTDFTVSLESIEIAWLDEIKIKNIAIKDPALMEMASIGYIHIDFSIFSIIFDKKISFDYLEIHKPSITVNYLDEYKNLNINIFLNRLKKEDPGNVVKAKDILINNVLVESGNFIYNRYERKYNEDIFDPNHFNLQDINANLESIKIIDGEIILAVNQLSTTEKYSKLPIRNLITEFHLFPNSMELRDYQLKIGKSTLNNSLKFSYTSMADFQHFLDSIHVSTTLKSAIVFREDIMKFTPNSIEMPDSLIISGKMMGTVSNFFVDELELAAGKATNLKGKVFISGLPDIENTFMELKLDQSVFNTRDIHQFYSGVIPQNILNIGNISIQAQFLGYPGDFVAYGTFGTRLGKINSDINLKTNLPTPTYKGQLKLINFDLGELMENDAFSKVTFQGKLEGSGFSLDKASAKVNGKVDSIELASYTLHKISMNASVNKSMLNGVLSIDDRNLALSVEGTVDFTKNKETIQLKGTIDTLNTAPLGISQNNYTLKLQSEINFQGMSADSIRGDGYFNNIFLSNGKDKINIDSLVIESRRKPNRSITVLSPNIDMSFVGNYSARVVSREIIRLINEYKYILLNDTIKLSEYGERNTEKTNEFMLNYLVNIKSINPLFSIFGIDASISDSTRVEGNFISNQTSVINFYSEPDTLRFGNILLTDNIIDLNSSIRKDTAKVLAMVYFQSTKQIVNAVDTENLFIETIWNNNVIDFNTRIDQEAFKNSLDIDGIIQLEKGKTLVKILESDISLIDKPWRINPDNLITFRDSSIYINQFHITSDSSALLVDGAISRDSTKEIGITFKDLEIGILNSLINKNLSGILNGDFGLSNIYKNPKIENELRIKSLAINDFPVGDVEGKTNWNKILSRFELDLKVFDEDLLTMSLGGSYTPSLENSLDLQAVLNEAPINLLEPFIGDFLSDMAGKSKGRFTITGGILNPQIDGTGIVEGGHMKVNYLNADFDFSGGFSFSTNKINLNDIQFTDPYGNKGNISGLISHGGFQKFELDLKGNVNKIQILNTTASDNAYFYGEGYGTGNFSMSGPVENLTISANVTTEKGTRIFIPIEGSEDIRKEDFISFVNFSDSTETNDNFDIQDLSMKGLDLNLNLDITPDAYVEIIFDIKAGDIIRGRGNGDLTLNIDTNGEFRMFGSLGIIEGWYNFTLYNLINKEFVIEPGGTISWYGDPYEGVMDLNASYQQFASLAPIMDPSFSSANEMLRKYPANVNINLTGPLLNPNIGFDIEAEDLPNSLTVTTGETTTTVDLATQFQAFKNRVDEQEIRRQAFSLIVLKRFSPPESFNTGGAIGNSVSELFSNQLSYWMSQVDRNLQVDFDIDLSQLDEEALNTFQLRLSYTFLDGRLRVSRDGTFIDYQNQVNASSLAGDWSVEYLLTEDGRMKVRMYNKTNSDTYYRYSNSDYTGTTGVSFQYTHTFNEFFNEMNRIFRINKNKEEEEKQDSSQTKRENMDARLNEENEED